MMYVLFLFFCSSVRMFLCSTPCVSFINVLLICFVARKVQPWHKLASSDSVTVQPNHNLAYFNGYFCSMLLSGCKPNPDPPKSLALTAIFW
jgi:hypothetical protein